MRIAISKTIEGGGGVDHYNTNPDGQGTQMANYNVLPHGLRIEYPGGRDHRVYPWSSISFYDLFAS